MEIHLNYLGISYVLLISFCDSLQNVRVGVDLVTNMSNGFVYDVLEHVSPPHENFVFSPFGLSSDLAMILEASDGPTEQEILKAFDVSSEEAVDARKGFGAYCHLFLKYSNEPEAAGTFNSASLASSFRLDPAYKNVLEKHYCADVGESLPSSETVLELNSVAGVTSHWKDYEKLAVYTFLSHRSVMPFKTGNDSYVPASMIPQVGAFGTGLWENARVVLLPLQAKLVHLLLIVPNEIEESEVLAKKLKERSIPLLVESLSKREMEVFIPQTTIVHKELDLKSVLIRRGIRTLFDPEKANLKKASPSRADAKISLKNLRQNAFFSTSFVALNSVSRISAPLGTSARPKRDANKFYVDRPFFFFVLQKDTQLVLLAGKVENPVQVPAPTVSNDGRRPTRTSRSFRARSPAR